MENPGASNAEVIITLREPDFCWSIRDKNLQLWQYQSNKAEFGQRLSRWTSEIAQKLKNSAAGPDKKPRVSVIIPARNEQGYILQVLESLANQTGFAQGIEIIVVANNSSDLTVDIARRCGVKVIEYHSEKDALKSPIAFARQKGLEEAEGEIILTTDADTIVPPEWVRTMSDALKNPGASVVNGFQRFYSANPFILVYDELRIAKKFLSRKNHARGNNMAFRKEDALSLGGYNLAKKWGSDGRLGDDLLEMGKRVFPTGPGSTVWVSPRRLLAKGYRETVAIVIRSDQTLYR